ncbi:hypothetical protein ABET14_04730 [Heyndrickxia coagulans]|uniref:hypothetical protein n=1 Tax=Heyndrickxia coagulans TaxID=1398 RepID=UPI003D20CCD2
MENIAVSLIVDGGFKNVAISQDMLNELAIKLRKEGKCFVHTQKGSYEVEGIVITAKGVTNSLMVLQDLKD